MDSAYRNDYLLVTQSGALTFSTADSENSGTGIGLYPNSSINVQLAAISVDLSGFNLLSSAFYSGAFTTPADFGTGLAGTYTAGVDFSSGTLQLEDYYEHNFTVYSTMTVQSLTISAIPEPNVFILPFSVLASVMWLRRRGRTPA